MALSTRAVRRRKHINYKQLHEGDCLPHRYLKKSKLACATVLPGTYSVERIICQKHTPEGKLFLVKWVGYHRQESTWEPESHISDDLLNAFLNPPVVPSRLQSAAETFERAVQQRLASKSITVSVEFNLDVYIQIFSTDESVLISSKNELQKLPLCTNWSYKVSRKGAGIQIAFPFRVSPRCYMRPVYIRTDNDFVKILMPVEKIDIVCAVEPYLKNN